MLFITRDFRNPSYWLIFLSWIFLILFPGQGEMNIFLNISATFWSPDIWLPPNITWEDISPNADNKYANYQHLIFPLPMAFVILGIRYTLER